MLTAPSRSLHEVLMAKISLNYNFLICNAMLDNN